MNKDKGKGKEVKSLLEAKDPEAAPKLKDAPSKAKDAAVKAKRLRTNPKRLIPRRKTLLPFSRATKKTLLRSPRRSLGSLSFALLVFCLHVNFLDCVSFAVVPGVLFLYLMKDFNFYLMNLSLSLQYLLLSGCNRCFALC